METNGLNMNKHTVIQQGDVILRKLPGLPRGTIEKVSQQRCVLAQGEHTGHAHLIEDDEAELIRIGEKMLLRLGREATVRHQEHLPITLSPGIWEVGQVHEYDYLAQMVRKVQD